MKSRSKKMLVVLAALFLLAALMTSMSAAKTEITFWAMPNAPDETHIPWMNKKAAEFEAKTGVKVKFQVVGWGDAWPKITTAIATGEGADVFQVGTTWNPQFAATGGLEQINIKEFGGASAFMKANLDSTTYKSKYYGIPWFAETRALFVNKDMFAKAGAKYPTTHAEIFSEGEKIVKKFGEGSAIAIAGTNAWDIQHNWVIILWANGGSLLTKDNKKAAFNSQAGVTAMKWYMDLVIKGLASKACAEYNQPQADAAFINGNVAMCYMGPWNIANIKQDNPKLPFDVIEPPAGPKGKASFSGGSNLVILKSSRNKAAAKAWVKFLMDNNVEYCKNLSLMLPSKVADYNDPYYSEGVWKTFKTVLSYSTAYPPLGVWGDVENAFVQEIKNILTDYVNGKYNDNTVKTYLDRAAKRVDAALAKER
jgi:multiple sugar transport system substrate-binding protein